MQENRTQSKSVSGDFVARVSSGNNSLLIVDDNGRVPEVSGSSPELCIVVPVFDECANVEPLVSELIAALGKINWEVIFVDDDSPDGTANRVRDLARKSNRVRCVQRIGRRGLSTACIEGMLASAAPYLAVMDGDLQHDPKVLPKMLEALKSGDTELVVGSRYADGGSLGNWDSAREKISRIATRLGRTIVPATLRDPMSGFFMLRRSLLEAAVHNLSGLGFKILLDIFSSSPRPVVFQEIPFVFRTRQSGESKLDSQVVWEYLMLLADKLIGRYMPIRFLSFILIGGLGLVIHLTVLRLGMSLLPAPFVVSQSIATFAAIVFNFTMNNVLTYRDKRRHGWNWVAGLISFSVICGVGAVANIGIASYLFAQHSAWFWAAIAGSLTGAVWNYAVTSVYTWGKKS
jgi:dolichol-phosphate mannosyltransferase